MGSQEEGYAISERLCKSNTMIYKACLSKVGEIPIISSAPALRWQANKAEGVALGDKTSQFVESHNDDGG